MLATSSLYLAYFTLRISEFHVVRVELPHPTPLYGRYVTYLLRGMAGTQFTWSPIDGLT